MNLQTIADALAATVGTVTATAPDGSTEQLTCSAHMPDVVSKSALWVVPPFDGDLGLIMGPRLDDHWQFGIRLARDPMSMASRTRWLYAWATALRTRVQTNIDLGVAGVVEAQAVRMRVEIDGYVYASATGSAALFDTVDMQVDVHVLENTSASI
jgi:hypothetical protein